MSSIGRGDDVTIYYTLDGTTPNASSKEYTKPIVIKGHVVLKAYADNGVETTDVVTHEYTYETPQTTPLTVAFKKPDDWAAVYLYTWNDGGETKYTGDWPGSEMTTLNDKGFLYHQFDAAVKSVNFIFNNGEGTQTADLWTDEDVCYAWENAAAVLVECDGTDVENVVIAPQLDLTAPMYNVLGQQVNIHYRGIVIQNGYKYIR
jgi:hypothetical protein